MYPQRSVMTCGLATALEPPHFNHAPVRGAIGASFSRRSRAGSFNPRTRVGCDQCVCVSCLQLHCVSIHAPAWGATPRGAAAGAACWFQSTHPRGVRREQARVTMPAEQFQSTHPRGVRPGGPMSGRARPLFQSTHPRGVRRLVQRGRSGPASGFNPRTRVGCD